jgi:hypothetical protein
MKYLSVALHPLWTLAAFSVSKYIHSQHDSLDGGSARRTAAICTHTDIHASSGIRTHDPSVRVGEGIS